MITKDGRSVSLTKILQLVGGITATWVVIKFTLMNQLNDSLFGLYLAYVAGVEGYSKFVAAKYGYNERSIRDQDTPTQQPSGAATAAPSDEELSQLMDQNRSKEK
jgi:hypothetical protein